MCWVTSRGADRQRKPPHMNRMAAANRLADAVICAHNRAYAKIWIANSTGTHVYRNGANSSIAEAIKT